MNIKKLSILLISLTTISSCGTLIGGKTTTVNLLARDPSVKVQAEISQDGINRNVEVPSVVVLNRSNSSVIVTIKEDKCYKSSQTVISPGYNLFTLLDFFGAWFSTTSTTVDVLSGAAWSYDKAVFVNVAQKDSCKK